MMSNGITLEEIKLEGFRAYLREQKFPMHQSHRPQSLAIFAPNARGKSSLVDGIEFFFSDDGSIKKLGQRATGTQAGRAALAHAHAAHQSITPAVTLSFYNHATRQAFSGTRQVDDRTVPPRSEAADQILSLNKLDFIIRGHELRGFVEAKTTQERYKEVSEWFGFSPLVEIQKSLRTLRLQLKQTIEGNSAELERLKDLKLLTGNEVSTWQEENVLRWIKENYLEPLDSSLTLAALNIEDVGYKTIRARKESEDKNRGLSELRPMVTAVKALWAVEVDELTGEEASTGRIAEFEQAASLYKESVEEESAERGKAEKVVFNQVWEAAIPLFQDESGIDACPVCETPLEKTPYGTNKHIAVHLQAELESLKTYRNALSKLQGAEAALNASNMRLRAAFVTMRQLLTVVGQEKEGSLFESCSSELQAWAKDQPLPNYATVKEALQFIVVNLEAEIKSIEESQGPQTYANALKCLDDLITLKNRLQSIEAEKLQYENVFQSMEAIENFVVEEIKVYIQGSIDALKGQINSIYQAVQFEGSEVPAIHLEILPETRVPELVLKIDFTENCQGVAPSGYLSDSQVHTLALALRLASIRFFNPDFPVVVLDDVVTSYDADHRKAIVSMLAEHFSDFQIVLVTHDERFFTYLQDHMAPAQWTFKRILRLDREFGPFFQNHKVPDQCIEELLRNSQPASNDIRQIEEEWLKQICREFGVDIRMRELNRPYEYNRSELVEALSKFLSSKGIAIPLIPGFNNPFLISLQRGSLENFGSHHQDDPWAAGSTGDERQRWAEFKAFRDMFKCVCGKNRFKRPTSVNRPLCASCETSFAFALSAAAVPSGNLN